MTQINENLDFIKSGFDSNKHKPSQEFRNKLTNDVNQWIQNDKKPKKSLSSFISRFNYVQTLAVSCFIFAILYVGFIHNKDVPQVSVSDWNNPVIEQIDSLESEIVKPTVTKTAVVEKKVFESKIVKQAQNKANTTLVVVKNTSVEIKKPKMVTYMEKYKSESPKPTSVRKKFQRKVGTQFINNS